MANGPQQQDLVDSYADRLELIGNQAAANLNEAMERSLESMLADLRRWYQPFLDPTQTSASGGRPLAYSIADTSSRFRALVDAAQGFLPDEELRRLQQQFQDDLGAAMTLGGDLAIELRRTITDAITEQFGAPNTVAMWSASEITTGYIRSETLRFRNQVTQLVIDATAQGHGFKRMQRGIEDALRGSADPDGITARLGLKQRAELIARSELANAYVEAQLRTSKESGFNYVRRIATKDERACPLCVSRHGNIYKIGEVIGNAHPRCRCSLSPVMDEAVEEKNKADREILLDADYWRRSQAQAQKELQEAKGWDDARLAAELKKAINAITPSERYKDPKRTKTVAPAVRF